MRLASSAAAAVLVAALSACSPRSPDAPQLPQPATLTVATQEGPTAECPGGGVRIDVGLDDGTPGGTARDGILEPEEIDTTVRVCGATQALVKVSPEPPGVHCAAGGSRVDVGVDDGAGGGVAGDGVLEPGEIERTAWVCNGASASGGCAAGGPPLDVAIEVSAPANGAFFVAGEQPVLSVRLVDGCGATASLGSVSRAELFLTGPRRGVTVTSTAASLLNCVTDRAAPDHQHHYIDLRAPSYADATHPNLAVAPDGLLVYTLAPVSTEQPGTYTAAVWATTADGTYQLFRMADLQIGTATPEPDGFGGTGVGSTCAACHLGRDAGRVEMEHALPSVYVPAGQPALDSAPVASCAACHNAAGYSPNPLVEKAHGVHRGVHLAAPGDAHLDYGLAGDPSLAAYTDVTYPVEPGAEKDCASCHADDRWATAPSRLACGTCHDAVRFADGMLVPPRIVSTTPPCSSDQDCAPLGALLTCDLGSGTCERQTHPVQTDDASCATCHSADGSGSSPIPARHEIVERTQAPGLALRNVVLYGGTGTNGAFMVGDAPALDFELDAAGTVVTSLLTNPALSATFMVAGPTSSPQRVYAPIAMKTSGTLTFDAGSGRYHFVAPSFPQTSVAPANADPSQVVQNASGTYRVVFWVNETVVVGTTAVRDAATAVVDFRFGAAGATQGRDVVTDAACNACHATLQYHGGTRRSVAACGACHTAGALDRGVGSRGLACTQDSQCPGSSGGWEACQVGVCTVVVDPTPGRSVAFADLAHRIHSARLRGGWAEQAGAFPGSLVYLSTSNAPVDFSNRLLSVDGRNCTVCHADAGTACATDVSCGAGQACVSGACRNVAWTAPSTAACLGCHDTASDAAHAALETWTPTSGPPVEACATCHGPSATSSVASAHRIADPTVPLEPREP